MSDASTTDDIVDLEFDLSEPPAKVWRALVEPDTVSRWIAPGLQAGGKTVRYDLLDAETGSRVSYRWREGENFDGVVTFSISVNAIGGTRLRIVQSQLAFTQSSPPTGRAALYACRPPRLFAAANLNTPARRRAA